MRWRRAIDSSLASKCSYLSYSTLPPNASLTIRASEDTAVLDELAESTCDLAWATSAASDSSSLETKRMSAPSSESGIALSASKSPKVELVGTAQKSSPSCTPIGSCKVSHNMAEGMARQTARKALAAAADTPESFSCTRADKAFTAPQCTSCFADSMSPPWHEAAMAMAVARRSEGASPPSSLTKFAVGGGGSHSAPSSRVIALVDAAVSSAFDRMADLPRSMARTES
mmetsp:Transcript_640/g.1664  ORF Transcript_640/g.1664 Transcript_640/m.1664 type:complete len:229 (-) Transcript_640:537-1223(-)